MNVRDLQERLRAAGHYGGAVDGKFGPKSRAAFRKALTSPARRLTDAEILAATKPLGLTLPHVRAFLDVEASGEGQDPATGLPIIRYEGHQFKARTGGVFDRSRPDLSFAYVDRKAHPQPREQDGRWKILEDAVALVPQAALESTSWGLGQVMGFNAKACGFADVWSFTVAMASGEAAQLRAMLAYLDSAGLVAHLKAKRWGPLAIGYNGQSAADNDYAGRLERAYVRRGGR